MLLFCRYLMIWDKMSLQKVFFKLILQSSKFLNLESKSNTEIY